MNIHHDDEKICIPTEFLLSPEGHPVREAAASLYPAYLRNCHLFGKDDIKPQAIPVLDHEFMISPDGRWARILAEVSYAEHIMKRERVRHTVVFFGSARISENGHPLSRYYKDCQELARRITVWSLDQADHKSRQPFVITTGGGPAIMEAGNRGATEAGGRTIGLNITLPMEQSPNPYISDIFNFQFHYFFTRKFHFSYRAKALVAFPGGFGTFDELFEVLTLIQTEKIRKPMKILLYGKEFWNKVINFDYLVEIGMISASDLKLFEITDDVDFAEEAIVSHLKQYQK